MSSIRTTKACLIAILAICAVVTATAQAVESEWLIDPETLTEREIKEEEVLLSGNAITLSVPGKKATIKCESAEGSGKIFKGGADEIIVELKKCKLLESSCTVSETLKIEAKSQPIPVGSTYYEQVEPLTEGKPLATFTVKGEKCPLSEKSELIGKVAAKTLLELSKEPPLKFSEALTKEINATLGSEEVPELALKVGSEVAYLSGELFKKLSGGQSGAFSERVRFTKLCKVAPGAQNSCTTNWGTGTTVRAEKEVSMKFKEGLYNVTCTTSKLEGQLSSAAAPPAAALMFTVEYLNCTSEAGKSCKVEALQKPWQTLFNTSGGGNGEVVVSPIEVEIECDAVKCLYGGRMIANATGGATPTTTSPPVNLTRRTGSGMTCKQFGTLEGVGGTGAVKYKFTLPTGGFWLTG
jgi:hypothetical protein